MHTHLRAPFLNWNHFYTANALHLQHSTYQMWAKLFNTIMKYKPSTISLISLLRGIRGLDSSFRTLYKTRYKIQMRSLIIVNFSTL